MEGNALTLPAVRELAAAIHATGDRAETRVLRLRGRGDDFSVGRAAEAPGPDGSKTAQEVRTRLVDPIMSIYASIRALPFPVVAEVGGRADGLGCAIVAMCDVAIAANSARFSLPEVAKNLPPTLALSAVARKVSAKTVARLVYGLGELNAGEALAAGLIGEVVADGDLSSRSDALCAQIASRHAIALQTLKRYLQTMHDPDATTMGELAASMLSSAVSSIRAGNVSR